MSVFFVYGKDLLRVGCLLDHVPFAEAHTCEPHSIKTQGYWRFLRVNTRNRSSFLLATKRKEERLIALG